MANALLGESLDDDTLIVSTSGRYEFRNKGVDVYIESMNRLLRDKELKKKVKSMFTDPQHLQIEDPGHLEGNTVFTYLDAFCEDKDFEQFLPEYKNLDEMKAHYTRGGLGDGTCKKFLYNVLNSRFEPIRERRHYWEQHIPEVYEILRKGTEAARERGIKTLNEVKQAMQINYFDDKELIAEQAKRFATN